MYYLSLSLTHPWFDYTIAMRLMGKLVNLHYRNNMEAFDTENIKCLALCISQFQEHPSPPPPPLFPQQTPGHLYKKRFNAPLCRQFTLSNAPLVRASQSVKYPTDEACCHDILMILNGKNEEKGQDCLPFNKISTKLVARTALRLGFSSFQT